MDAQELEEVDLGIYLAKHDQEQAAHLVFSRLLENHPDNIYLLTLCAFTAGTPAASLAAIEMALKLDPANSTLLEARSWLEEYHQVTLETTVSSVTIDPLKVVEQIAVTPQVTVANLKPSQKLATQPLAVTAKPNQPIITPAVAKIPRPVTVKKAPAKPKVASFSGLWWLFVGCLLLFFAGAIVLFYMIGTADNLTEPEKTYLGQINLLNQQTNEVNSELQAATNQYNAGSLEKSELEKYLRHVIGLDEKFRLLKSPSGRFAKLNGLLSQAYDYFNQGAVSLIFGLNANDSKRVNEGNRQLNLGKDYLRQARDELKKFGG